MVSFSSGICGELAGPIFTVKKSTANVEGGRTKAVIFEGG